MEIPVNMFQNHMHIVVKDRDHPLQIIGEANVPLTIFTGQGPREERIPLNTGGFIHMRSEFIGMGPGMGVSVQP
jgi:hypothetical protein